MKNILLNVLLLSLCLTTFSQRWSNFDFNLSYQGNKLLNDNLQDDQLLSTSFSFNPSVGIEYGINMNEYFQIGVEFGYTKVNNSLSFLDTDTVFNFKGKRKISLNTINLGLVLKGFTQGGYYIEGGIVYNLVLSAKDIEKGSLFQVDASSNVKNYVSLIFGGGVLAYKKDRTNISVGFRGEFAFTDLISSYGKEIHYPTYYNYNNNDTYRYISGMIIVNLSYDIGILNNSRQTYRYSYFR
jgi:hypothetical protein